MLRILLRSEGEYEASCFRHASISAQQDEASPGWNCLIIFSVYRNLEQSSKHSLRLESFGVMAKGSQETDDRNQESHSG
jgi:hypothetical protein